jgi:hypothetical protein
MNQCLVCNADFEPTNANHKYCSNLCVVRIYGLRKKVKEQINATLKTLRTPDALKTFDTSLQDVLEVFT